MARITDLQDFKGSGCTCYQTDKAPESDPKKYPDAFMCFSKGAIGTLNDTQDKFCKKEETKIIPYEMTQDMELGQHQEKFEIMGKIMDECMEEEYDNPDDFLSCTTRKSEELKEEY